MLPDLDQQAPSGILVLRVGDRTKLGFTSAVDNIGDGPIHIRGTRLGSRAHHARRPAHPPAGRARSSVVPEIGRLAYEPHPPHFHWHLEPYESYELRRADDDTFVARDGKSGFCLLDRWGHALRRPGIVPGPPRFVGDCAALQPEARRVDEGSSVGYTDRYPGFFHGQDIDITGLEPGLYVLVHRANPERRIRELRYSNNDASALIRISPVERRRRALRRRRSSGAVPRPTGVRQADAVQRFDVLVVGAGPAGSATAIHLARGGARVLLADRARFPRDKPCGGGVTGRALRQAPCDIGPVVERVVHTFELRLDHRHSFRRTSAEPLILMTQRRRLDAYLVEQAVAAGASFRDNARVEQIEIGAHGVDGDGRRRAGGRDVLVGADGANGVVARAAGLEAGIVRGVALEGNVAWTHARP